MSQKDTSTGRARGTATQREHGVQFLACGYRPVYYVALLDENRHLVERLSGFVGGFEEARQRLRWIRRRHPEAAIVREITLVECMG